MDIIDKDKAIKLLKEALEQAYSHLEWTRYHVQCEEFGDIKLKDMC